MNLVIGLLWLFIWKFLICKDSPACQRKCCRGTRRRATQIRANFPRRPDDSVGEFQQRCGDLVKHKGLISAGRNNVTLSHGAVFLRKRLSVQTSVVLYKSRTLQKHPAEVQAEVQVRGDIKKSARRHGDWFGITRSRAKNTVSLKRCWRSNTVRKKLTLSFKE